MESRSVPSGRALFLPSSFLILFSFLLAACGAHAQQPLTQDDVAEIVKKYAKQWNEEHPHDPLSVIRASPGDSITIPNLTFGTKDHLVAGLSVSIHTRLIILNQQLVAESALSTFFHELGHTRYAIDHPGPVDQAKTEAEAIRFSLESLAKLGYEQLAYREARLVTTMPDENVERAVTILSKDPLWLKYSPK